MQETVTPMSLCVREIDPFLAVVVVVVVAVVVVAAAAAAW